MNTSDTAAKSPLDVLLWRQWVPSFAHPLTFSSLSEHGIGGTDLQMLLHARHLVAAGHRVQVLGASHADVVEEGVDFVAADSRVAQERCIRSGRVRSPSIVLLEGGFSAARYFKQLWPDCHIVHVGQNIDAYADRQAFAQGDSVDLFAFVSRGHVADYSVRYPALRHKFVLLRNVVPWEWIYRDVPAQPIQNRVVWVGSWHKKGLRQWAAVMARTLAEFPAYEWTLCGPKYDGGDWSLPPEILYGLKLPKDRVSVKTLPLRQLAHEVAAARVVIVSLGNETASISALDAHALGRPVVSGNDVVYKFNNPEGTGIRVTTSAEAYDALSHLLRHPELCDRMGQLGRTLARREFTERQQAEDLEAITQFLELEPQLGSLVSNPGHSRQYDRWIDLRDKVIRKYYRLGARYVRI